MAASVQPIRVARRASTALFALALLTGVIALVGPSPATALPVDPITRLTDGSQDVINPSISDDGRWVLYEVPDVSSGGDAGTWSVRLLDRETGTSQQIGPSNSDEAQLSGDGSTAVYVHNAQIYRWQRSSGSSTAIAPVAAMTGQLAPRLSTDARYIAFYENTYIPESNFPETQRIYRYDVSTSTKLFLGDGVDPEMSDNGQFVAGREGNFSMNTVLYDVAGGTSTTYANLFEVTAPPSNDGRYLTYSGGDGVSSIDRTTSTTTVVAPEGSFAVLTDTSPDGRYIAWTSGQINGQMTLHLWDRTTGQSSNISTQFHRFDNQSHNAAVSPDGNFIAFGSTSSEGVPGDDANGNSDIYLWTRPGSVATVPEQPAVPTGVAGTDQVTLSWTAPANGGSPITGYRIVPSRGGVAQPAIDVANVTTKTVTGLRGGASYTFTVAARNAKGLGPASAASTAVIAKRSSAEAFVTAAYEDYIGRAPTETELVAGLATVADASSIQKRSQFTTALAQSDTYLGAVVNKLYVDTLGRVGDPGGVTYWTNELRSGRVTVAQTAGLFYSSGEYFAGYGNNNLNTWVTDLYNKILLRSPDTGGLNYYVNLAATTNRYTVAYPFYQSLESSNTRVKALYQHFLGRPADQGGLDYWASRIPTLGDVALASNLTLSTEYLSKASTRYP